MQFQSISIPCLKGLVPSLAFAAMLLQACNVSDPKDTNEQEVFTTVKLLYTNSADSTDKTEATIKFKEGFGHGGDVLEKNETIKLKADADYAVELVLLDESRNPAEVMSEEVEEEGEDHQVFYTPASADVTITYADKDKSNRPIGLKTTQKTGVAGTGTLKVTLKHQPDLKSDNSTIETGETDVAVVFNLAIQ